MYIDGNYFEQAKYGSKLSKRIIESENNYGDIYNAYGNPSQTKVDIFKYWERFCYKYNGSRFGVYTKSCHFFTLSFWFVNPETGKYQHALITPYHNYVL